MYFTSLTLNRFLLGQVVGTILFPPWSETFGRKNMYIVSSGLSAICCMIIGIVRSMPVIIVMRIVAGLLSAIPFTIIGGSIEDMFNSQARIWTMYYWTVASNIGLILGPIMSSYIIASLDWYVTLNYSLCKFLTTTQAMELLYLRHHCCCNYRWPLLYSRIPTFLVACLRGTTGLRYDYHAFNSTAT